MVLEKNADVLATQLEASKQALQEEIDKIGNLLVEQSNQLLNMTKKSKKKTETEQSIETLKKDRSDLIARLQRLGGGKEYFEQNEDDNESEDDD